jgi:hypothetical protein
MQIIPIIGERQGEDAEPLTATDLYEPKTRMCMFYEIPDDGKFYWHDVMKLLPRAQQ